MKELIYDYVCPVSSSQSTGIFSYFYTTFYGICNAICDSYNNFAEMDFIDPTFQDLTTISASQPLTLPCTGDKCTTADYFDVWINQTSSNVFSQTSRKKLYQKASYTNWYDVFGFVKFWWTEVIKRLYDLFNNIYENIQINPVVYPEITTTDKAPLVKNLELAADNFETKSVNYENVFHFLLLYCVIGGMCLIVFLINRMRIKTKRKSKDLLNALDIKEIETNVIQKLIKILKETKSVDENFKKNFETNYCTFTDTIKNLEKKQKCKLQKGIIEKEKDKSQQANTSQDSDQINKLEKQCKIYQKQIRILEQQLTELLKNHRAEVKNYFAKNKKIQLELGKSQNWLDLSHQLHKTEANHLHEYIAQLQAQYENNEEINLTHIMRDKPNISEFSEKNYNKNLHQQVQAQNENIKSLQTKHSINQRTPQEIKNHLQAITEVCLQFHRDINKVGKESTQIQAQHENIAEVNAKYSSHHKGIQHQHQEIEEFSFKPQCGSPQPSPIILQPDYKNVTEIDFKQIKQKFSFNDIEVDIGHTSRNNELSKDQLKRISKQDSIENIRNHFLKAERIENNQALNITEVMDKPTQYGTDKDVNIKSLTDQHLRKEIEYRFPAKKKVFNKQENFQKQNLEFETTTVEMLNKIEAILSEVKKLKHQVKEFNGSKDDKTYLHLNGILIEQAIELNNIKCDEDDLVLMKNSNKVWKYINKCREILESKVNK